MGNLKINKKKIVNMFAVSMLILVLVLSVSFMGCKTKTAAEANFKDNHKIHGACYTCEFVCAILVT